MSNPIIDNSTPNTDESIFSSLKASEKSIEGLIAEINQTPNLENTTRTITGENVKEAEDQMDELLNLTASINASNEAASADEDIEAKRKAEEEEREAVIAARQREIDTKKAEDEAKIRDEMRRQALEEMEARREAEANEKNSLIARFNKNNVLEEEFYSTEEEIAEEGITVESDIEDEAPLTEEEQIDWHHTATHDSLTGLLNKTAFDEDIDHFDINAGVLIFFDANNLKYNNDTFGHEAGDKLLGAIATELNRQFYEQAYRLGGDEFIVITSGSKKDIEAKLNLIDKAMAIYTKNDSSGIIYAVSYGVAYANGKKDIHSLRKEADALMYENKKAYKESHKELDLRAKPSTAISEEERKWKELALKDQSTGLFNKTALEYKKVNKLDIVTLITLKNAADLRTSYLEERVKLLSELLIKNIEDDLIYFIPPAKFILFNVPDTQFEVFKQKADALSIATEYAKVTNFTEIGPVLDALDEAIRKPVQPENIPYNDKLSASQRRLKNKIKDNHEVMQADDFDEILHQIRRKRDEIIAIFMTSSDFNHLFIFSDVSDFLDMVYELDGEIDFSYLYAIYEGGAAYFGMDEYSKEVTDLFQTIAEGFPINKEITDRDIKKIEGINTFEFVHLA